MVLRGFGKFLCYVWAYRLVGVTDAEAPYSTYAKSVNKIETWGSDILFMGNYKQTVNSQKEHPP